jgi:hypothetical protein
MLLHRTKQSFRSIIWFRQANQTFDGSLLLSSFEHSVLARSCPSNKSLCLEKYDVKVLWDFCFGSHCQNNDTFNDVAGQSNGMIQK